ncbi:MAG: hypothetical protein HXX14_08750 [Bacteroidetes bacterium]|nr:hypothetical protein [Bacteroidota bacterium]
MKKLAITLVALFLLVGSVVNAQQRVQRTPEERAKMQTEAMQKGLALTDDQVKKVLDINLVAARKMDSIRTAAAGDRDAMMAAMKPLNDLRDAKLKTVLTKEQAEKYEANKAEYSGRRPRPEGQPTN